MPVDAVPTNNTLWQNRK